jgi:starvation-inducible DNA-binding protein
MQPTRSVLSQDIQARSVELLSERLAVAIDLHAQARQAHWSVRGPGFTAIHEPSEKVAVDPENYPELIMERARGLGGTAPVRPGFDGVK